jgi:hypothetical protein
MPPAAGKNVPGRFLANEGHLNGVCELVGREPTLLKHFIRDHIQVCGGS